MTAMAMSLEGRNNFRSFIYSHSSTKPENSVKIGAVDVETIGLAEIVRTKKTNKKHRQNTGPPSAAFRAARAGGLTTSPTTDAQT